MPRPTITRNVYRLPPFKNYGPYNNKSDLDIITMNIEEYESIRLIDHLNMTQAEAAIEMGVGRTTIQRIYFNARKKIAESFVNGRIIHFDGGDYCLRGQGKHRGHRGHNRERNRHLK